jgi:hypothetical protein
MVTKYRRVYLVSIVSGRGLRMANQNGKGRKYKIAPKIEKIYLPSGIKFIDVYKQIFVMH